MHGARTLRGLRPFCLFIGTSSAERHLTRSDNAARGGRVGVRRRHDQAAKSETDGSAQGEPQSPCAARSAPRQADEDRGADLASPDAAEVVGGRDERQQRARSGAQRLRQGQPEGRCPLAQTLRRAEPSPQERALSLGHVDADLLHQSRRQKPFGPSDRARLEKAKDELRKVFHRKKAK